MSSILSQSSLKANRLIIAATLLMAGVFQIAHQLHDAKWLIYPLAIAILAVPIVAADRLGRREWVLLSIVAALTLLLYLFNPDPIASFMRGFEQASFMLAFVLFLGQLHEPASHSPSLGEIGAMLTRQKKSIRDSLIFFTSGAMSVFFSVGVASFLIPIFRTSLNADHFSETERKHEFRRQIVAMLRGHAASILWSPTALAPLTLLMIIPGIHRFALFGTGVALFFILMVFSLVFTQHRPVIGIEQPDIDTAKSRRASWGCASAAAIYLGLIIAFAMLLNCEMILAMMIASPTMLVGWIIWQEMPRPQAASKSLSRLKNIFFNEIPASAPAAVTMAASGFIGRVAGEFIPESFLSQTLRIQDMPDVLLLSAIPPLFCLFSLLALSPIVLVTFFGGLLASLDPLPADPTLMAIAICCGCTAAITFSPLAPTVLVSQRVSGLSSTVLTFRWNLVYTLGFMLLLVPFFALLTR